MYLIMYFYYVVFSYMYFVRWKQNAEVILGSHEQWKEVPRFHSKYTFRTLPCGVWSSRVWTYCWASLLKNTNQACNETDGELIGNDKLLNNSSDDWVLGECLLKLLKAAIVQINKKFMIDFVRILSELH